MNTILIELRCIFVLYAFIMIRITNNLKQGRVLETLQAHTRILQEKDQI